DVNAGRRLALAREGELPGELRPANRIDAEADRRQTPGIVEALVDALAVLITAARLGKIVRMRGHEGILEQVPDAACLQRLDRGLGVTWRADVVAVVDDRRRAIRQHLESADI